MGLTNKLAYAWKVLPGATRRGLRAPVSGPVHLIFALADHFEPAIDPSDGRNRVPRAEQERRLEWWCQEYPKAAGAWRDSEGRPFVHTYFYPAEQYDEALVASLADHCHQGWGEIEIHLHHGMGKADTVENTRRVIAEFRDCLALQHRCLSVEEGLTQPRYAFVHGNWALANSARGTFCGVDSEMQILAETGCYADMTLPASILHPAQIAKMNSVYECALPLEQRAPHREGRDLAVGHPPQVFPLIIQGPLVTDVTATLRHGRPELEDGAITSTAPLSIKRLPLWKRAGIGVAGRPDWIFIKLCCHGMNPTQKDEVIGHRFRRFLDDLVTSAAQRNETLHFVTAREMTNIVLAACDGREGNPADYRDYRFRRYAEGAAFREKLRPVAASVKG